MYTAIYTALTGVPMDRLKIQTGGDHIDTKAVRSYLNNLEASLKSAKFDSRSYERPYSSMSWRSQDLAHIENKSRLQSWKSSSYGQVSRHGSQVSKSGSHVYRSASMNISRPVSGHFDTSSSQRSGIMASLPPSERLMLETNKPRLLHRGSVNRKLGREQKPSYSPRYSPTEMQSRENLTEEHLKIDTGDLTDAVTSESGVLLDSFGNETDRSGGVKFQTSPRSIRLIEEHGMAPERLFKRFASTQNVIAINGEPGRSGEVTLRTEGSIVKREHSSRFKRPGGSARSIGSSLHTSTSGVSLNSHRSSCDIPRGPHSVHLSNARTTTVGPHSSVKSLMGNSAPKDITKSIHHKSAWYHVPGRYTTGDRKYPPKRSQQRAEAKQLAKTIVPMAPNPHKLFMKSEYRKNNPNMLYKGYPGKDGHTCSKGQTYTPYPKDNKQYIICDTCQQEAVNVIAMREQELNGVNGVTDGDYNEGVSLAPTVNGLMVPDRPRQSSYVFEEPMIPDDYSHPTTVTFKDTVVIN